MRSVVFAAGLAAAAATLREPRAATNLRAAAAAPWRLDAAQVPSTLYSESLCPDCVHFETGVWNKAYLTQGIGYGSVVGDGQGIVTFSQVSFGNAKITPDNQTITCQHGATECLYNTLEACAIQHYPQAFVPFVVCLSAAAAGSGGISKQAAQKCASNSRLTWATLNTCWTGPEGKALDIAAAYKTAALKPAHTYVPWVTLAAPGTFCTENGCDTFIAEVCKAYTGTKPAACSAL